MLLIQEAGLSWLNMDLSQSRAFSKMSWLFSIRLKSYTLTVDARMTEILWTEGERWVLEQMMVKRSNQLSSCSILTVQILKCEDFNLLSVLYYCICTLKLDSERPAQVFFSPWSQSENTGCLKCSICGLNLYLTHWNNSCSILNVVILVFHELLDLNNYDNFLFCRLSFIVL